MDWKGTAIVLIDGPNIDRQLEELGGIVSYRDIVTHVAARHNVLRGCYYTGLRQAPSIQRLSSLGYKVRHRTNNKSDVDVMIAVDMLLLAGKVDTIVLLSGDSDFEYAVEMVASRGTRVAVVSHRASTSRDLIRAADEYVDLARLAGPGRNGTTPAAGVAAAKKQPAPSGGTAPPVRQGASSGNSPAAQPESAVIAEHRAALRAARFQDTYPEERGPVVRACLAVISASPEGASGSLGDFDRAVCAQLSDDGLEISRRRVGLIRGMLHRAGVTDYTVGEGLRLSTWAEDMTATEVVNEVERHLLSAIRDGVGAVDPLAACTVLFGDDSPQDTLDRTRSLLSGLLIAEQVSEALASALDKSPTEPHPSPPNHRNP